MDPDLQQLEALVGDITRFADTHWGQRTLLRSGGGTFTDLLDLPDIERLLSSARTPTFRLVQDGTTLPGDRSATAVRLGGRLVEGVADLGRIADAVGAGATLVLQGLQRTWPPITSLCRALERAVSHPVQANAYLTPAGSSGLARHHDSHDVLVLQVLGHKAWDVSDLGPVETKPGDVLYIPARVEHEASTQDGMSLHLTLGILRVSRSHVVRRALDRLAEAGTDRPLPLGFARPERAEALVDEVERTLADASRALAAADRLEIADAERARAASRRAPAPDGALADVLHVDALSSSSVVTVRPDHHAHLHPVPRSDGRLVLQLHDRRVLVPALAAGALMQLLEGSPVEVGHLADLDPDSQLVLVRRLVREGLLRVVRS